MSLPFPDVLAIKLTSYVPGNVSFYNNPAKNKTHECHNSGVTTCVFSFFECLHVLRVFTCAFTVFYVVNRHNTRENTYDFISKIKREYAALFLVG